MLPFESLLISELYRLAINKEGACITVIICFAKRLYQAGPEYNCSLEGKIPWKIKIIYVRNKSNRYDLK
jgi:hypothetical protein